jgi:CMP-N-acetylneuraminic acid synthetase
MSEKNFLHLALIPARGGSIGVKNKNLRKISGVSLVETAWHSCLEVDFFDTVLLSTDSPKITREITKRVDFSNLNPDSITFFDIAKAIHRRSDEDAKSTSPINHLLTKISNFNVLNFDFLWLIQPTTPFRSQKEFSNLKYLAETKDDFTSIVSVKDATHNHPDRMLTLETGYLKPFLESSEDISTPRQLLSKVYLKDGAFYIFRKKQLSEGHFLGKKIIPFLRSSKFNINIDTSEDLMFARSVSNKIKNK